MFLIHRPYSFHSMFDFGHFLYVSHFWRILWTYVTQSWYLLKVLAADFSIVSVLLQFCLIDYTPPYASCFPASLPAWHFFLWMLGIVKISLLRSPVAHRSRDPVLSLQQLKSLLWLGFHPGQRASLVNVQKRERKKERQTDGQANERGTLWFSCLPKRRK